MKNKPKPKTKLTASDIVVFCGVTGGLIFFCTMLINHFIVKVPVLTYVIIDSIAAAFLIAGVLIYEIAIKAKRKP